MDEFLVYVSLVVSFLAVNILVYDRRQGNKTSSDTISLESNSNRLKLKNNILIDSYGECNK